VPLGSARHLRLAQSPLTEPLTGTDQDVALTLLVEPLNDAAPRETSPRLGLNGNFPETCAEICPTIAPIVPPFTTRAAVGSIISHLCDELRMVRVDNFLIDAGRPRARKVDEFGGIARRKSRQVDRDRKRAVELPPHDPANRVRHAKLKCCTGAHQGRPELCCGTAVAVRR
jgi:hypothetical protein